MPIKIKATGSGNEISSLLARIQTEAIIAGDIIDFNIGFIIFSTYVKFFKMVRPQKQINRTYAVLTKIESIQITVSQWLPLEYYENEWAKVKTGLEEKINPFGR